MARKVRHSSLETRTSRLKLAVKRKPYSGPRLARGAKLDYRRCVGSGTWVLKASDGRGGHWTKGFAQADDFDESDGKTVLTFFEAQDIAKQLARGGGTEADSTAPITVDRALTYYTADLLSRAANAYNAEWPRRHLTATLLSKPVALLTSRELNTWKLGLLAAVSAATVNRICNSLRAALELAAQHDPRIANQAAWRVGLAVLPGAQSARNVVLPDDKVHALVAAAYRHDPAFGRLADLLAVTGTRPLQAARLTVEDLHDSAKPRLMMPKTGKGGGRNRASKKNEKYAVPITAALAARLKAAAAGRAPDAPLLLQANGRSWGADPSTRYRRVVREVLTAIGLNPDEVTLYSLRHSSICRMLLRNVPIRVVAALHDTSVAMIEKNYSANLPEHSDDISRVGLLAEPVPLADNIVALKR